MHALLGNPEIKQLKIVKKRHFSMRKNLLKNLFEAAK